LLVAVRGVEANVLVVVVVSHALRLNFTRTKQLDRKLGRSVRVTLYSTDQKGVLLKPLGRYV
jgi:hypothetical protein